jgi:hypothetical protein
LEEIHSIADERDSKGELKLIPIIKTKTSCR